MATASTWKPSMHEARSSRVRGKGPFDDHKRRAEVSRRPRAYPPVRTALPKSRRDALGSPGSRSSSDQPGLAGQQDSSAHAGGVSPTKELPTSAAATNALLAASI